MYDEKGGGVAKFDDRVGGGAECTTLVAWDLWSALISHRNGPHEHHVMSDDQGGEIGIFDAARM